MRLFRSSSVSLLLVLGAAFNGHLAAQTRLELGPVLGYYSATTSAQTDGPNAPGAFSSHAYGAEATLWFSSHVAVRAEYLTATKQRNEVVNPAGYQPGMSGHISVGDLLATYGILRDRPELLWIAAGPGYVRHDGNAFEQSGNPTDFAGVLSAGSTQTIAGALRFTFGASAFLYRYAGVFGPVGGPPVNPHSDPYGRRDQHDVVLHAALAWAFSE